jgi:chromosome segregation and condensation protein ScpB
MLYATTDKFLRVFGINSLAELPATESLAVAAQVESEKASAEQTAAESAEASDE